MLKRLGENLAGWRPSKRLLTPLDTVRGAWVNIVGAEVAKHCMPGEIRGKALTVYTRSGTWSQQLDFLADDILAKLVALDAGLGIEELRFRVGKIAAQSAPKIAKRALQGFQARPDVREPATQGTLEEMIARGKTRAERRLRESVPRCVACGQPLDRVEMCAPCRFATEQARIHAAMRILRDAPWLGDEDLRRAVRGVADAELARARDALAVRWRRELDQLERKKTFSRGEPERATALAYVLLVSGCAPDRLTRAMTRHILGPRLDTLVYGEMA